jgi:pantoate--beta-alanine ligase
VSNSAPINENGAPIRVVETVSELRSIIDRSKTVALVPTLGAIHAGHLALVERAREVAAVVVVSIFVNPLQFGPAEDFEKYPRSLDKDVNKLAKAGVDLVFAPSLEQLYPDLPMATRVSSGHVGSLFEGKSRPGHFDGVLTVVAKLLNIVQPSAVVFGRKDAQQAFLVRRMIADLNFPVKLEVVDIVREDDGLALSSRNQYLDTKERRAARVLSQALEAAASAADRGVDSVIAAAQSTLMGEHLVTLDYFSVVNPATFLPVDDGYRGKATILIAARVGSTRLIDNEPIVLGG